MKAAARLPCRLVVPTKIAKARCLEMAREEMRIATENEKTMPTLANVRNIPEEIPNTAGGDAFMTAELFAGKKRARPGAVYDARHHDDPQTRVQATIGRR